MFGNRVKVVIFVWAVCGVLLLYLLLAHNRTKYSTDALLGSGSTETNPVTTAANTSNVSLDEIIMYQFDKGAGLPKDVRERIGKFLLFVGSGKSGHSIVGSLLDAHEHIVVSHEYHLFRNWKSISNSRDLWVENLYNKIYWKSHDDSVGIREESMKGYSLKVDGLWQGHYKSYISVIGDKSGGSTCQEYMINRKLFRDRFTTLSILLSIPIRFIHVIRNPFDHVASRVLYAYVEDISAVSGFKQKLGVKKFLKDTLVLAKTKELLSYYNAEAELIDLFKPENVMDVHIADLVNNPKQILREILNFLEVDVTDHYLDVCAAKVYRNTSRTRNHIQWPIAAKKLLESAIHNYSFLGRYNFSSN